MKRRMSRYWAVPGAIGLALVMVAVLAWTSSPGSPGVPAAQADGATATFTPTATATPTATPTVTPNPSCDLRVTKDVDDSTVGQGGEATYTITVKNEASSGHCTDIVVTDTIPSDTDCVSASWTDDDDLTFDQGDIDDTCTTSGTVEWDGSGTFDNGDKVVLTLVLKLTSGADEDQKITNEACATSEKDPSGNCDTAKITVGAPVTATPTTAPTATARPTVQPLPLVQAPPPAAAPLPALAPPITGTGSDGDSSRPLAIGLGLAGLCLLLVSGAAMVKRTR